MFIEKGELTQKDINTVLMFGAYLSKFGIPYQRYVPDKLNAGKYNGLNLNTPLDNLL